MIPEALREIELQRRLAKISIDALERAARIGRGHYRRLLRGLHKAGAGLVGRLRIALSRLKLRQSCDSDADFTMAIAYRMAVAIAAGGLERDPAEVHGQDPARRATQDPAWMRAAEVRRLAVYLMNTGAGFRQTDTARAAGLTKQAVSLAVREIEERRSDAGFDALVERLTISIVGDWSWK